MFDKPKSASETSQSSSSSSSSTTSHIPFPSSRDSSDPPRLSTTSERPSVNDSKQRATYLTANPVAFQLAEMAQTQSPSSSSSPPQKKKSVSFSQPDDMLDNKEDGGDESGSSFKERQSISGLRESFALGMDPEDFLELPKEGAVNENGEQTDGGLYFSYRELVRRNYNKDYDGINSQELETYLTDKEFEIKFGVSKEAFAAQPKWRRIAQKKALLLF